MEYSQSCREMRKSFVEVVHLCKNANHHHNHEDVGRVVSELVVARKCELKRYAECLDRHDRHATYGTANGDVDQRVLATVLRSDFVDHDNCKNDDEKAVEHEGCDPS